MKKIAALGAVFAVITVFAVVFGVIKNSALVVKQAASETKVGNQDPFRQLQATRVIASSSWYVEDGEDKRLTCIVQAFDQDPNYDGAGVKLSIFDQGGTTIYEDHFSEVQSLYSSYALRKGSPQLIMEVSYGGSASFLKMLDYQNGKIVDLMEAVKPNNDFDVNAELRPQLRTGVHSAEEPYQILLTEGVGLASPADKFVKVFRYKDGAYRYTGRFSGQRLDDYIEKLMQENGSNKGK